MAATSLYAFVKSGDCNGQFGLFSAVAHGRNKTFPPFSRIHTALLLLDAAALLSRLALAVRLKSRVIDVDTADGIGHNGTWLR